MPELNNLIKKLENPDYNIRLTAAQSIASMPDKEAITPLCNLLKDETWQVRRAVVEALGNIRDAAALESLIYSLENDDNWRIRQGVAFAIGYIGEKSAAVYLVDRLKNDEDWHVRQAAAAGLKMIGSEQEVNELADALDDPDWHVKVQAAETLGIIGNKPAIKPLSRTLENSDPVLKKMIEKAILSIKKKNDPDQVNQEKTKAEKIGRDELLKIKRECDCR